MDIHLSSIFNYVISNFKYCIFSNASWEGPTERTLSRWSYGVAQSYLKGGICRNFSLNLCWFVSKEALFFLMFVTSLANSGATCCLTVMAIFFVLFHCSGSSCIWKKIIKIRQSHFGIFQVVCSLHIHMKSTLQIDIPNILDQGFFFKMIIILR